MSSIIIPDEAIGVPNWRRVEALNPQTGEEDTNAQIKTYYQVFSASTGFKWALSSFYTADHQRIMPFAPSVYRAPASFGAWLTILIPLIIKYLRKPCYLALDFWTVLRKY